jgi:hypothetical protein
MLLSGMLPSTISLFLMVLKNIRNCQLFNKKRVNSLQKLSKQNSFAVSKLKRLKKLFSKIQMKRSSMKKFKF